MSYQKSQNKDTYAWAQHTRFGSISIIWALPKNNPQILRIFLSDPKISAKEKQMKSFPNARSRKYPALEPLLKKINRSVTGTNVRFSPSDLRLHLCSPFQRKVLSAVRRIPRGQVSTYQHIAKKIGAPRSPRAVGTALARNPFPLIIPCHRVIRSDRALGDYQGSLELKKALLKLEGAYPFPK